jgi:hypothetical protein
MQTIKEHYDEIKVLPLRDRLRLLELLVRDLSDLIEPERGASMEEARPPLVGLWAGEADVVDELVEGILQTREERRLRANDHG